jgi:DNA polymerase-1
MPPILYLIDGHALAYRMYFALTRGTAGGRWITKSGEPTAGVYGFTSVLLRILEQEDPDYIAVAFDTGKTFRDEIFPDYKGTREKMPDDLRPQIERIRQLDKRVIVNLPGRSLSDAKDYLPADVETYMGVRPDQIIDYKALCGDPSDNIPGVKGVGKKTAEILLKQYGTLNEIYNHLDELKPGVKTKLETDRYNDYLSQKLAEIIKDLQIPLDLEMARPDQYDPEKVRAFFREMEFRSLVKRLDGLGKRYGKVPSGSGVQMHLFGEQPQSKGSEKLKKKFGSLQVKVIDDEASLKGMAAHLQGANIIAFDTETTSTDQMEAKLVGISLAVEKEIGYYIPVGHKVGQQLGLGLVLEALRGPMTDPMIPKAGHNLKYDYVVLARYGLNVTPLSFDSMIAEWVINPASHNLGLKNLAWVRLDHRMTEIEDLIGKGKTQISMADVPISDAAKYAADDAAVVLRLIPGLKEEMMLQGGLTLFQDIEMPLVKILAEMEMNGICLDTDFLENMSDRLGSRLGEITSLIINAVGIPFNINSTQQLSKVLFENLKLEPPPGTRKTSSGFYSTAASVLESMRGAHPVVNWILEHRELSKLKSTYVDALPQQVNKDTMRVHTSYNQTGSRTGRLASSNPNLQNIPIRTELGREVRYAFIASPGTQLLAVDYSQVELRIIAHMAVDEAMKAAFQAEQDIHAATAAAIYAVNLDEVTKEQRRHAKAINFGLIYGMSAFGLTRTTDLTLAESEDFVAAYFKQFPGVKGYLDEIRKQAAEDGYVETLLGRRRYFPHLANPTNHQTRMREEREAINAPIQGTAADIMKVAMLRVPDALDRAGLPSKILLQVHDELVLECPTEVLEETAGLVQRVMENAYTLDVPLKTEARAGSNWGDLKPFKGNTP